jgi:hypothetical protein
VRVFQPFQPLFVTFRIFLDERRLTTYGGATAATYWDTCRPGGGTLSRVCKTLLPRKNDLTWFCAIEVLHRQARHCVGPFNTHSRMHGVGQRRMRKVRNMLHTSVSTFPASTAHHIFTKMLPSNAHEDRRLLVTHSNTVQSGHGTEAARATEALCAK